MLLVCKFFFWFSLFCSIFLIMADQKKMYDSERSKTYEKYLSDRYLKTFSAFIELFLIGWLIWWQS